MLQNHILGRKGKANTILSMSDFLTGPAPFSII